MLTPSLADLKRSLSGRIRRGVGGAHRAAGGYLGERDWLGERQRQPTPGDPLELDRTVGFGEPFAQDEQPRFEVVVSTREAEMLVEAQLPVRERCSSLGGELVQQLPEDPARDALDQVLASDKDAVIGLVIADRERIAGRPALRRPGRSRARAALLPASFE